MSQVYSFGPASQHHLIGVHPRLVQVVNDAIKISAQDFGVHEGVRSPETQKTYFVKGVTKTLKSKHLIQGDGFGHAVDLVPYLGGALRWEWPLIYPIAAAMLRTAKSLGVAIRWGGVWDRKLNDLRLPLSTDVAEYIVRHPGPDMIDGPHYELVL